MRRWSSWGLIAAGFLLGVACAAVVATTTRGPLALAPDFIIRALPTPVLGRLLLGPSATGLAGDSRGRIDVRNAIVFYDTPVNESEFLCRITARTVGSEIWRGGKIDPYVGSVLTHSLYGILVDPSAASPGSCAAYSDFANLFSYGGVGRAEDAVVVLALARDAARTTVPFNLSCIQLKNGGADHDCDGAARLRAVDLKDLSSIDVLRAPSEDPNGAGLYRFILREPRSYLPFSEIRIAVDASEEGRPARIRSVDIEVQPSRASAG